MEACFKGEEKEEEPTVLLAAAERKALPSLFFSPLQVAVVCLWQLPADSCCTHLPIIMIDLLFLLSRAKQTFSPFGPFHCAVQSSSACIIFQSIIIISGASAAATTTAAPV